MPYASTPDWWRDATVYQIYPRSFADSDGDGVGDLRGIIGRLDHLADLGIGLIWLSPVYASPMADNGYDISDYRAIAPEFGTLADFDALVAAAGARGIGIVMDLVVNHTSDRHAWFRESRSARDNPWRDFYVWRDPGPGGGPPSDLAAMFGGPAWTRDDATGQYYLHLFSPQQPDLNWANPAVRAEVYAMMNWWLDRGIAGFRMDVIDMIGKEVDRGITTNGPRLHDYLQEMHREALAGRNVVTVGEAWSASPRDALLYSGRDRGELSMVFQFEHVTAQWHETLGKWRPKPFDLAVFRRTLFGWQRALADDGWNSLYLSNHDLPRQVSQYGDDGAHWHASATMLATVVHLMKGTPYVYQGEEIGMTNAGFAEIAAYRDVETLGHHRAHLAAGGDTAEFLAAAAVSSRDNARTPMQWSDAPNAGFTTGTPWIGVNPNHRTINVAAQQDDPGSILAHYRRLIALRKQYPVIVHGRFEPHLEDHPQVLAYGRRLDGNRLTVIANFSGQTVRLQVPGELETTGTCLIANRATRERLAGTIELDPYEAFAILGAA